MSRAELRGERKVIKYLLRKIIAGVDLQEIEAQQLMEEITEDRATDAQIASVLTALKLKGETVDEITGFARVLRRKATPVTSRHPLLLDTCGTGGDGANTFNISTAAALVVAGAGAKVAKHGNKSVSSRCGSADVLAALGVKIDLEPKDLSLCLDEVGIAFLYAPLLHQGMKRVAIPRRELGFRTVFNILGPLTNPAGAGAQVVGVYSPDLVEKVAQVLKRLGVKRAYVVYGAGGLDEVSPLGPSQISEVQGEKVLSYRLDPGDYRIFATSLADLEGGDALENAGIILRIFEGEQGPRRDAVVMNAALGLTAAGLADTMEAGMNMAARCIDEGKAMEKLQELIDFTNQCGSRKEAAL